MRRPWEHVHRRGDFDEVSSRSKEREVAGEGGGVAGDVDDVRRGEAEEGVDEGFFAAFARGVEDDDGLFAGEIGWREGLGAGGAVAGRGDGVELGVAEGVLDGALADFEAEDALGKVGQVEADGAGAAVDVEEERDARGGGRCVGGRGGAWGAGDCGRGEAGLAVIDGPFVFVAGGCDSRRFCGGERGGDGVCGIDRVTADDVVEFAGLFGVYLEEGARRDLEEAVADGFLDGLIAPEEGQGFGVAGADADAGGFKCGTAGEPEALDFPGGLEEGARVGGRGVGGGRGGFRGVVAQEALAVFFETAGGLVDEGARGEGVARVGLFAGDEDDHDLAGVDADADDEVAKEAAAGGFVEAGDVLCEEEALGDLADALAGGVGDPARGVRDDVVGFGGVEADAEVAGGGGWGSGCRGGCGCRGGSYWGGRGGKGRRSCDRCGICYGGGSRGGDVVLFARNGPRRRHGGHGLGDRVLHVVSVVVGMGHPDGRGDEVLGVRVGQAADA